MRQISIYAVILSAFVLASCSDSAGSGAGPEGPEGDRRQEIIFGSGPVEGIGVSTTRAVGDFPNDGSIGILAAQYNSDPAQIDWTTYTDIHNLRAEADEISSNYYQFDISQEPDPHYWPFDGSQLVFMAYAPYSDGLSWPVKISYDHRYLELRLVNDMPDVMYASLNTNTVSTPFNKNSGTVPLGEFRHALSQLTVRLLPGESMKPGLAVTNLRVSTSKRNAKLDLQNGDAGPLPDDDAPFTYELVANQVITAASTPEGTVMLYPATQDQTTITFTLTDGPLTFDYSFDLGTVLLKGSQTEYVTLRRAEMALVEIIIEGTPVDNPDGVINLEGQLTDWIHRGDLSVTIN